MVNIRIQHKYIIINTYFYIGIHIDNEPTAPPHIGIINRSSSSGISSSKSNSFHLKPNNDNGILYNDTYTDPTLPYISSAGTGITNKPQLKSSVSFHTSDNSQTKGYVKRRVVDVNTEDTSVNTDSSLLEKSPSDTGHSSHKHSRKSSKKDKGHNSDQTQTGITSSYKDTNHNNTSKNISQRHLETSLSRSGSFSTSTVPAPIIKKAPSERLPSEMQLSRKKSVKFSTTD